MLRQRVITAVVLLALLLPALFARSLWPFAMLCLLAVGAAGWEWGRLNGAAGASALALGALLVIGGALAYSSHAAATSGWLWWAAVSVWVLGGVWALGRGVAAWPRLGKGLRAVVGLAILLTAWLALVRAKAMGVNFLLSVFCLVWAADIAAYFGGRAFGRHKLAPSISPGKSWEGVWSGMLGVLLLACAWLALDSHGAMVDSQSIYSLLRERAGWAGLTVGVLFLTAMSVVGDLFESMVKRSAGAKDSSQLLPGHGGVLDRIDALLPVFPIALALASF